MNYELRVRLVYGLLGAMFGVMAGMGDPGGMLIQGGFFAYMVYQQVEFMKAMKEIEGRARRRKTPKGKGWPW